ncbi:MAG: TAXI family TRAP transporter solute-binding subunit, partial [Spirochaetota bacterium]|nr:TAXI family TRAP transporter solute-binding subunit [Spirochaetota bacterium]
MKKNNSILSHVLLFLIILILPSCLDTDPPNNDKMKSPQFVSGPENSVAYPFAKGIIDAADEILGIFMNNQLTNGSVENGTKLVNEEAYLGLVQEDIFYYSRNKYLSQFNADPDNAEIKYLKIASQLKVIMSTYKKDLYLLINTDNLGTGITIDDIKTTDTLEINLGIEDSDNYISAKTVFDAHSFITTNIHTDAPETGIQKVISGEYDAAFLISETYPAPALQSIQADAPVELIRVYMPEDKKYYDEDGVIFNDDYLFVDNSIEKNITVRTLIVAGPFFSDSSIEVFIDYALDHTVEYKTFNQEWGRITNINSREYMMKNPLKCNYRALCHVTGYTLLDPFYVESYFCSGAAEGAYHDMTIELIWLLSHNLDIDLKEKNTTGTWENSYWMLNGNATMALVQDDIYSNLINDEGETYSIMQAASMRKVAPLHYEYVHLVVNTEAANWNSWNFNGSNDDPSQLTGDYLEQIFTDPSPAVTTAPVLHINVGPKTSGTYISAMKIINSYKKMNKSSADDPDLPDMDGIEIHYHFDSPSDSILKVDTGEYHMAFVTSGVPYHR